MELGIIGLSQSGKTTVFHSLIRSSSGHVAGQVNRGVAKVRDARLDTLTALFRPKREVFAEVVFIDIPGAPEGFGKSRGIAGEYLNALQRTDALLHVVRAFQDPSVPHVEGDVDYCRDTSTVNLELAFSDMAIMERRFKRMEEDLKGARPHERGRIRQEWDLLERLRDGLGRDVPIREQVLAAEERKLISTYQFLTAKPLLLLVNVGETQLPQIVDIENGMEVYSTAPNVAVVAMCGKLEAELAEMAPEDEEELRQSLAAGEPAALEVIRRAYRLLGLISFFTVSADECRAWTVHEGTPAVEAAGQIHSDMRRGFIRAEVVSYEDLVHSGGFVEAKRRGVLRSEGKAYHVKDGEVVHVLFNV